VFLGEGEGRGCADDVDELVLEDSEVGVAFFRGEGAEGEADSDVVARVRLGGRGLAPGQLSPGGCGSWGLWGITVDVCGTVIWTSESWKAEAEPLEEDAWFAWWSAMTGGGWEGSEYNNCSGVVWKPSRCNIKPVPEVLFRVGESGAAKRPSIEHFLENELNCPVGGNLKVS
jgi:hypothetical protein